MCAGGGAWTPEWNNEERTIRAQIRWEGAKHVLSGSIRMQMAAQMKAQSDAKREAVLMNQLAAMKAEAAQLIAMRQTI